MKNIYTLLLIGLFSFSSLINAQTNVAGLINTNTTWTQQNSPYTVTSNILVQNGSTLTIEPGVVVKVNANIYIKVEGFLIANGNETNKIVFTSNLTAPAKGDWANIWLKSTSCVLDQNDNYISGSYINHCIISFANEGIRIENSSICIKNSELYQNFKGINFKSITNSILKNNFFHDNQIGTDTSAGNENNNVGSFTNSKILNNVFENNISHGFSFGGYRNNSNNNIIKFNISKSNGGDGFYFQWGDVVNGFTNNIIESNIIYNNIGNGITICRDSNVIKKNIIINNHLKGINISGTYINQGLIIENNILNNNLHNAIDLSSNSNSIVRYNQILKSQGLFGSPSIGIPSSYVNSINNTISYNTIFNSKSNSIELKYGPNNINHNNFINNKGNYLLKILPGNTANINAENNFWSTTNNSEIENLIFDFNDNFELGIVDYTPFLNSPNILAPISPPVNVIKTQNGNNVVLTWVSNGESDLSGYKLYYGNPTGYSYDNVIDLGNVTSYTITNGTLSNEYAITAYDNLVNNIDDQVDGNESWFSIANTLPNLPTNITVDTAPRKAKISWTLSSSNNVTGYKIFKGITPNPTTLLTTVSNSTISYTDTGLTNGTTYYYSIKAVDSNGLESVSSPDLNATPTNTWYVATSGTITGFGSSNQPMSAIQTAIDASVSGEIVQVGNGTYTENIMYNGKNITVTSLFSTSQNEADITNTIIDGGANGLPVVRFHNNETNAAKLIGFTVQNGLTATNEWAAGVDIQNGAPELLNLKIKNNIGNEGRGGIKVIHPGGNVLIKNCDIFNNSGIAIYSLTDIQSGSLKIVNCKIHHNTAQYTSSIVVHSQQNPEIPVENTLIYQNTAPNVVQGSGLVFLNCTIVNNNVADQTTPKLALTGQSGIFNSIIGTNHIITNQGNLKISKSLIKDGQSSILGNILPIWLTYTNNISSNPMFVNEAQHNYKLSDYSPAIGFGAAVNTISTFNYSAPITDIEGNIRPNPAGSNPDLGVYENSFATTQHSTTIYVATNGNNTGSVGLETAPFATIQAAINYAITGDQILVKPGTYTEALSLNKAITIKSTNGYQQTTLKVSGVVGSIITVFGDINSIIPLNATISGFKFISELNPNGVTGIRLENAVFANVEKCWFENLENSFSTFYGYYDVKNSIFKNNKYIGNHQTGYSNVDKLSRIIHCNIINANKITLAASQYYHKIYNTIITREIQTQESYFPTGVFPLLDKVLIDANTNTQPGSVFTTISSINDLYFNDITTGDYSLNNSSPAIGYGGTIAGVIDDIQTNPRPLPLGSQLDAGAFENSLGVPSNAPPRINQVANVTIDEDAPQQTINLSGIADGDLLTTQTVTVSHTNSDAALFSDFTINHTASAATGTLVFTPAPNAFGTSNITITVQDDGGVANGGINSKTISFTITINPINDAPVAVDDSILVNEGETTAILTNNTTTVTNNDTDVDNVSLTAIIVTQPTNGSLTLNSNGTFSYTHNGSETTSDSFTYKANDGELNSNVATVAITVTPVNDAPVGNNDSFTVNEGATVTVLSNSQTSVLHNDTDAENNTLTVSVVATPTNGTLTLNSSGTFSYTHNDTETTTDSFTYKVNDGELDSNITTVNITINTVNDNGPTDITVSNFSLNENVSASTIGQFSVLDLDLPADTHAYELVSGTGDTNNSSFTINGTNLLNTAAFDYETNQTLSIRVKVTDANAVSYEKVFTINVDNVNDISITHTKTDSYCAGSAGNGEITINTVNQTMGSPTYSWTATNGGVIPTAQVNSQNLTSLPSGTYTVSITDLFFTYTESFTIALIPQYADLSICYVSSDETEVTKNRIFLNNQGNYNAANYEILRENNLGNFIPIGSISPDQNSYLDDSSNNTSFSSRYKVRLIDDCGNGLVNQTIHKTILLSANLGINNIVNLSWSKYVGTFYTTYFLYRKVNDGQFNLIYTTSASSDITSYNDQNADISINNYEYYVTIAVNTCSIQSRTTNNTIEVKSNIGIIGTNIAVNNFSIENQIMLFPNPTTNLLNIKLNDGNELISGEVYNSLGQKVLTITNTPFSVEQLPSASYLIKVLTTQGQATKMFIKN